MSHEATHVATGATFASMPTWLLEGFADYVALDRAGVPVDLAAGQILDRIRKEGLPDGLPTSAGPRPDRERSRCHLRGGLAGLPLPGPGVRRRAAGAASTGRSATGPPPQEAFRSVLGTTQREFVARWRADLARLAGVAG